MAGFIREVSTLGGLLAIREALEREQDRERSSLRDSLVVERERGTVATDLPVEEQLLRLTVVLEGHHALLATRDDVDPAALSNTTRSIVRLLVSPDVPRDTASPTP